ncbi:hypothetical protein BGZ99_008265 [Dissophora globulifera]|uniref:Secreted protein n=1 Tax=Dissophora globulifera TaxID=979702 RepID=A0A9P6RBS0_9FUNG|nr:hypothetical protein BGZ99_008265 [Dissophora globulifera]
MKLSAAIAFGAVVAVSSSTVEGVISAGCTAYLNGLAAATNPLAACRTYTAIGFPDITHANDHDTVKLQSALTTYCAKPACTAAQYAGVYKDLQTNCAADMTADNQQTLGTVMYMWYMSPAQHDAVCFQNAAKTNSCVVDSINEMIARAQLPDANPNEDDLYGYIQYVTPFANTVGVNATAFCSPCNQQVANIFSNYYTKTPSPYTLNFAQNLTSVTLNTDLMDKYKRTCSVTLGLPIASGNGTAPAGSFQPTNQTQSGGKTTSAAARGSAYSLGGLVASAAMVAGALLMI